MESFVQNLRSLIKFVAVVAILVAVYLFVAEFNLQRDMTEANIYSLASQSESIARSIDTSTTLYFFHTPQQGSKQIDPERVRTLLKQYASLNDSITFREVDHTRRPNLARKHNVRSNNTVMIKAGDRTRKIGPFDMIKMTGRRRRETKFQGESAISTALQKLTLSTDRTIYFTTGHGEYQRSRARRNSVSRWFNGLRDEGYRMEPFNPLTDTLPDTRDLIVMVGPSEEYGEDILAGFRKWHQRGGNLLIAVGGNLAKSLNPLLSGTGLEYNAQFLIDPARRVRSLQSLVNPFVFAPKLKSHPAVRAVKDQGLGIQMGRSTALSVSGDTAQALLRTSGEAFAKTVGSIDEKISTEFNPETDQRGPFTVGAVVSSDSRGTLLAFGSPTLFANSYLQQAPGNEDFALNLVNWLFDRDVSLGIRATPSDYNRVSVTARQAYLLEIIALGVIPLGIILWGGVVWWNRKNR